MEPESIVRIMHALEKMMNSSSSAGLGLPTACLAVDGHEHVAQDFNHGVVRNGGNFDAPLTWA